MEKNEKVQLSLTITRELYDELARMAQASYANSVNDYVRFLLKTHVDVMKDEKFD